jgi:hypothetical protein
MQAIPSRRRIPLRRKAQQSAGKPIQKKKRKMMLVGETLIPSLAELCNLFRLMKKLLFILLAAALCSNASETVPLPESGWKEDFNSFCGTHASLPPGTGVSKDGLSGMSPDDSDFRGISRGNVTTGGCYAWETATGDRALGFQPTVDKFTPGWVEAAFSNSSDRAYRFLKIKFDAVCLNNENRSSTLQLEMHLASGRIVRVTEAQYESEEAAAISASWTRTQRSGRIEIPEPVESGQSFILRWVGNDKGGSGSRDEYGIDNIEVKGLYSIGTVITIR